MLKIFSSSYNQDDDNDKTLCNKLYENFVCVRKESPSEMVTSDFLGMFLKGSIASSNATSQ